MKVLILETGAVENVERMRGEQLIAHGLAAIAPEEAEKPAEETRTTEEPSEDAEAEKTASEAEKNAPRKNGKKR